MGNTVDTVEDKIQVATLNVLGIIFAPKIDLAVRSTNASLDEMQPMTEQYLTIFSLTIFSLKLI